MPFYYLKQIPLADFCKKRWQHLSNNWANGFERNRSRASCEATWGMQGIEHGPLAFTCANRNNSFANLGRYVETETAPDYKDYLDSTTASISKFMRMVNWNETNEVKEAHKLVSDAESSLFANQMKSQMFDSQLNEINRQITAEEAYKKEVEARLSRIMGFVESYKSFIESESVKIDGMEIKFTDTLANLKVLLSDRNIKLASLSTYVSALSKSAEGVVTEETLTQLPQLQATYEALQNNQYQTLCVSKELKEQVSRLQAIQAYRIDLADRLVSSVEYFEDSAEFNDAKVKFTAQAEKLSGQVSEKNYVFNPSFAILINKPEVCQKFDNARAILDTLRESAANSGSSSDIKNVRNLFQVRLTALKAQQALLVQKTKVRNQVYSIMKDLEDNFNSGYLTQLYQDQVTARSRILAASDYAKSFLQGEELKSLQEIINQKLTYFDQRSPVYTNLQQGRFKLQTRLNRFVNEVAEFKDQANDQELGAIASDVESFLPVVFRYNPNQVTAQIPAVENVNELSGLDSFLSDVEQRFTAIKELSK